MISETDLQYLRRCIELAEIALASGDEPFGSVLVSADGKVLFEDHNRVAGGDHTQHPEFALARWAAKHMTPEERSKATVYTSGEHCPMCAAAQWLGELGVDLPRVRTLPIQDVIRDTVVDGPVPEFAERIRELHRKYHAGKSRRA